MALTNKEIKEIRGRSNCELCGTYVTSGDIHHALGNSKRTKCEHIHTVFLLSKDWHRKGHNECGHEDWYLKAKAQLNMMHERNMTLSEFIRFAGQDYLYRYIERIGKAYGVYQP